MTARHDHRSASAPNVRYCIGHHPVRQNVGWPLWAKFLLGFVLTSLVIFVIGGVAGMALRMWEMMPR